MQTTMKRLICAVCLLAFGLSSPVLAQKKKTNAAAEPKQSAEQLIQNYRFSDAARVLQREIDAARAAGRSTERLEADLQRANMGTDMLRGTERVVFVDSFKVGRQQVLASLRLSRGAGQIVKMKTEASNLRVQPAELGTTGYINELKDRIVFAAADSAHDNVLLHEAYRSGNGWGRAVPLEGMQDGATCQDFPFLMPDGVTLYYAAQGEGSLGGYDIFVTRYNADTKQFLKAENMGMPFNSPANDYMLAIDEQNNLGWLVTDRHQEADSACVYVFVPNATREVYEMSDANRSQVLHAAQLHAIADTQTDAEVVKQAQARLAALKSANVTEQGEKARLYVINDKMVYTRLSQFRSEAARRIAEQADRTSDEIERLQQMHDRLQQQVAAGARTESVTNQLLQINKELPALKVQLHTLEKNMRKAELQ